MRGLVGPVPRSPTRPVRRDRDLRRPHAMTSATAVIRQSIRDDTRAVADGEIAVRAGGAMEDVHRTRCR